MADRGTDSLEHFYFLVGFVVLDLIGHICHSHQYAIKAIINELFPLELHINTFTNYRFKRRCLIIQVFVGYDLFKRLFLLILIIRVNIFVEKLVI